MEKIKSIIVVENEITGKLSRSWITIYIPQNAQIAIYNGDEDGNTTNLFIDGENWHLQERPEKVEAKIEKIVQLIPGRQYIESN